MLCFNWPFFRNSGGLPGGSSFSTGFETSSYEMFLLFDWQVNQVYTQEWLIRPIMSIKSPVYIKLSIIASASACLHQLMLNVYVSHNGKIFLTQLCLL